MALKRRNPFLDFLTLEEKMEQLFDEAFSRQKGRGGMSSGAWAPAIDIYETDKEIILTAELSGVDPDDVSVEANNEILTLSGVRKFNKDLSEEQYLRMERSYGSFQRVFTLPSAVNEKAIKAKFKDGILRITLPKTKGPRPKRIKVEGK